MREAVIVAAVRTPVGKFQGSLAGFTAPKLGALAVREAVRRSGFAPGEIDVESPVVTTESMTRAPLADVTVTEGLPLDAVADAKLASGAV